MFDFMFSSILEFNDKRSQLKFIAKLLVGNTLIPDVHEQESSED